MKEPPGDTHSDGSFIVYEMETGQKWAKTRENARKPSKMQKNLHDASIKVIVQIWSECKERSDGIASMRASKTLYARHTSRIVARPKHEQKEKHDQPIRISRVWSE